MDPLQIVGSVIDGVIGGISQGMTNRMNYKIAQETNENNFKIAQMNNEYNKEMFDRQLAYNWDMFDAQNKWNLAQWNRENAYNSASAQAARFKQAGLNPALMMGSGNAGTASSVRSASGQGVTPPRAESVTMQAAHMDPLTSLNGIFGRALQYANIAADTRGKDLDNDQKQAYGMKMMAAALDEMKTRTAGMKTDNAMKEIQKGIMLETRDSVIQTAKNQARAGILDNYVKVQQIALNTVNIQAANMRLSYLPAQLQNEYVMQLVNIANAVEEGKLTKAKAREANAHALLMLAQKHGVDLQNEYQDAYNQTYVRDTDPSLNIGPVKFGGRNMLTKMADASLNGLLADKDYKRALEALTTYQEEYAKLTQDARVFGTWVRESLGAFSESLPGINFGSNIDDEYYGDNKGNVKHRTTRHKSRSVRVGR